MTLGGIGVGTGLWGSVYLQRGGHSYACAKPSDIEIPQLFREPLDSQKSFLSEDESQFLESCTSSREDLEKLQELMIQRQYVSKRWPEDLCVFLNRYEGLQELVNVFLESGKIFEMKKHTFDVLYEIAKNRGVIFSRGSREESVFLNRLKDSRESEIWGQEPDLSVYIMLRINPSLASLKGFDNKSVFSWAVENGCSKTAKMILGVLQQQRGTKDIMLSQMDFWNRMALMDLTEFDDAVFSSLSKEMQEHVYRMANVHQADNLVEKLNRLGMRKRRVAKDPYPCDVLNRAMDVVQAKEALSLFLHDLRNKNCLMTQSEFDAHQKATGTYFIKKGGLGRVIGRNKVLKAIDELKLKHVKVPQKIAVIKTADRVSLATESCHSCDIYSNDMIVYAEKIEGCDRHLSWEEMQELLTLIKHVHFGDIWSHNFVIAKDGVYLIDMENKSFQLSLEYHKLNRLVEMIDPSDVPHLQKWISSNRSSKMTEFFSTWETKEMDSKELSSYLGWNLRTLPFSFPINDIISTKAEIVA